MTPQRSILGRLHTAAEAIATTLFAAIFVIFLWAIFARYVLGMPAAWPDELNMVLLVWTTFLAEALVLGEREQVRFEALWDLSGPTTRRVTALAATLLTFVLFAVTLPVVWGYVAFLWRERTNVLQWRLDWVFSVFVLYWVAVVARAAVRFVLLLTPRWRELVADVAVDERANVLG